MDLRKMAIGFFFVSLASTGAWADLDAATSVLAAQSVQSSETSQTSEDKRWIRLWEDRYCREFKADCDSAMLSPATIKKAMGETMESLENGISFSLTVTPNFYEIVKLHLKQMVFFLHPACGMALAVANKDTGTITICPLLLGSPLVDRIATLVHESKHLEPSDPLHVACVGGKFDGNAGGCDERFYGGDWNGSGYNADLVYLRWTQSGIYRNELSASIVQSSINALLPDRFNDVSIGDLTRWRAGNVGNPERPIFSTDLYLPGLGS